jgi:hypothetical protein
MRKTGALLRQGLPVFAYFLEAGISSLFGIVVSLTCTARYIGEHFPAADITPTNDFTQLFYS